MSSEAGFTNYGQHHCYTIHHNNLIRGQHMDFTINTRKIRLALVTFAKDFKAGFLPMFLYLTAIILVIWLLNALFSKEVALTILFGGVGIYLTSMLGGLKRLRGQNTVFEKGWDTINEDDPNVSQR